MAEKTARGRFVPWSMTKTQLESQNPVPIAGEMVFESDTGRKKIGNGTSAWNALPYVAADNTGAAPASHASSATTYGAASATNYGHAKASAAVPASAGTAAVGTDNAQYARGDHVHPAQTSVTGNAGTATKLATARSIALTGGVTGSANFDGSSNVSISTALANVATAGTTGETANKTLGFGGAFTVPQLTINAKGLTTAVTARTMTMPAEPNGVRYNVVTGAAVYRYKWLGMHPVGRYVSLFPDNKTSPDVVSNWSLSQYPYVPTEPIVYNDSETTIAADYACHARESALTDIRYNLNVASINTWQPVYLIGIIAVYNNQEVFGFTGDPYFTQTLPTTNDGAVYWHIGTAASSTTMQLNSVQPLYYYKEGLQVYVPGQYLSKNIGTLANTSFTLSSNDEGKLFRCMPNSNMVITISSETYFSTGGTARFFRWAAATITIRCDPSSSLDLYYNGASVTSKVIKENGLVVLTCLSSNMWVLSGDIA
jgi:hypothetical protein